MSSVQNDQHPIQQQFIRSHLQDWLCERKDQVGVFETTRTQLQKVREISDFRDFRHPQRSFALQTRTVLLRVVRYEFEGLHFFRNVYSFTTIFTLNLDVFRYLQQNVSFIPDLS